MKAQKKILEMLKFDEQEYERVGKLKLLGTVLTEYNDITADIKFRIIVANEIDANLKR
jgi:hypothetical protein